MNFITENLGTLAISALILSLLGMTLWVLELTGVV